MTADLVLVGGGLANCLIAYRLAKTRPELDVVVVERQPMLGGRHTWSFHEHDLTDDQWGWIRPLVEHSWCRHEVRFPGGSRILDSGYHSISSHHLGPLVMSALGDRVRLDAEVREVTPHRVVLADGAEIRSGAVIDGRGDPRSPHLEIACQKFLGRFVAIDRHHGLEAPILMDATVEQRDGYRFVYTLPLTDRSLLIEDTMYSDTPSLDRETIRAALTEYAERHGWGGATVTGEEEGVLPIVLSGDIERFWDDGPAGVPRSGMRAALFHPTTGYSFPEGVRMADALARERSFASDRLYVWTRRRSVELWRRTGFFRLLNRMLFRAAEPDQRYRVLERFYRLPESLIRRFYAGRLASTDKIRLVTGSPPVPIGRALSCLPERRRAPRGRKTERNRGRRAT